MLVSCLIFFPYDFRVTQSYFWVDDFVSLSHTYPERKNDHTVSTI